MLLPNPVGLGLGSVEKQELSGIKLFTESPLKPADPPQMRTAPDGHSRSPLPFPPLSAGKCEVMRRRNAQRTCRVWPHRDDGLSV